MFKINVLLLTMLSLTQNLEIFVSKSISVKSVRE